MRAETARARNPLAQSRILRRARTGINGNGGPRFEPIRGFREPPPETRNSRNPRGLRERGSVLAAPAGPYRVPKTL